MCGLGLFQTWVADIFSDLDVGAYILEENVSIETFSSSFEAHRLSNNMAPELQAQRQE